MYYALPTTARARVFTRRLRGQKQTDSVHAYYYYRTHKRRSQTTILAVLKNKKRKSRGVVPGTRFRFGFLKGREEGERSETTNLITA